MDKIRLLNGNEVDVPRELAGAEPAELGAFIVKAHKDAGLAKEWDRNLKVADAYRQRRAAELERASPPAKAGEASPLPVESEEASRAWAEKSIPPLRGKE